jgi:hypothetical protein
MDSAVADAEYTAKLVPSVSNVEPIGVGRPGRVSIANV